MPTTDARLDISPIGIEFVLRPADAQPAPDPPAEPSFELAIAIGIGPLLGRMLGAIRK